MNEHNESILTNGSDKKKYLEILDLKCNGWKI